MCYIYFFQKFRRQKKSNTPGIVLVQVNKTGFFFLGHVRRTDRSTVSSTPKASACGKSCKPPPTETQTWAPEGSGLRTDLGISPFQFLASRLDSKADTASDLRQTRAAEYAGPCKILVRGRNVQACSSPLQAAPDRECFRQIRGICQAGPTCIRLDGQQERKTLQEGVNVLFNRK